MNIYTLMFSNLAEEFYSNTFLHFAVMVILMVMVMFIAFKAGLATMIMAQLDLSKHSEPI